MKKYITLAALLAAGSAFANAATDLYLSSTASGDLLATDDSGYFTNLFTSDGSSVVAESVLTSLTTSGNTDYNLIFNSSSVNFSLSSAVYFNQVNVSTTPSTYSIDFGTIGSITTASNLNLGNNANRTFSFTFDLSDDDKATLASVGSVSRILLNAKGNWGIWNFGTNDNNSSFRPTTLTTSSNFGSFAGVSNSEENIEQGQYGLVFTEGGANDSLSLVVKAIPEPSAFGLLAGLGALALVGTRRRRR